MISTLKHDLTFITIPILFILSLIYSPLSIAFAVIAIYYIAKKTTPFEDFESFIAYTFLLQLVVLMVVGVGASFISFSQQMINSIILLISFLSVPLPDKKISGSFKNILGVFFIVFLVYFIPVFVPGMQTEDGVMVPFIYTQDYWFHLSISHEIYNGLIPPENPQLAGAPFNYYWFSHLYNATVAKIIGIDIVPAFRIIPFIALFAVASGAMLLSKKFFNSPYLPAILICASGPLAAFYLKYGFDMLFFPLIENFVEYRSKTIGTALFLVSLFFYLKSYEDRKYLKYTVVFAAFLPVVSFVDSLVLFALMVTYFILKDLHLSVILNYREYILTVIVISLSLFNKTFLTIVMLFISAYILFKKTEIKYNFSLSKWTTPLISVILPLLVSSFYLIPLLSASGEAFNKAGEEKVLTGWTVSQSHTVATTFIFSRISKFIGFFGVPFFFFITFFPYLLKCLSKDNVRIPFLLFLSSFSIGISFKIIPVLFNLSIQHRFTAIGAAFLKLSIIFFLLNVYFLLEEKIKKRHLVVLFVIIFITPTVLHGYLRTFDAVPYGSGPIYVSYNEMNAFEWINKNTSPYDLFVVQPMEIVGYVGTGGMRKDISPPLIPFTGRRVVIGSDVFSSVYSFEDPGKLSLMISDINLLYNSTDLAQKRRLLERYHPNYIYIGPLETKKYSKDALVLFDSMLQKVYDSEGIIIYKCCK